MAIAFDGARRQLSRTHHQTRRDRISQLPEDVIQLILECMPVEDAVRTSALSRNWRYYWTTISKFVFDESFLAYLESKNSDASIITNILHVHHNPRISCFHLYVQQLLSSELMGDWLLLISRKGVKKLSLVYGLYSSSTRKSLPSQFYSCVELTHLHIKGFGFNIPSKFRGFPSLISLELHCVTLEEKSFGDLISSCPVLESLTLRLGLPTYYHLNIRSRSLKHLTLEFFFRSICIEAPGLKTLSLNAAVSVSRSNCLVHVLLQVPSIDNLTLGSFALVGTSPMTLPKPLSYVRSIKFDIIHFEKAEVTNAILCILRSSPALEELEFLCFPNPTGIAVDPVSSSLGEVNSALRSLKVVRFISFGGSRPEVEIIRFILGSAPTLEKIFIKAKTDMSSEECKQVSTELMGFMRTSPKAELIYSFYRRTDCRRIYTTIK